MTKSLRSNDNVGVLPHKISEASGQVHCGRAATQHRQDALQVEELQQLMPAGVQMNTDLKIPFTVY